MESWPFENAGRLRRTGLGNAWRCLALCNGVKIVSPPLHHFAPFGEILRMVVGGTHLIALAVCKLPLDYISGKAVRSELCSLCCGTHGQSPGNDTPCDTTQTKWCSHS